MSSGVYNSGISYTRVAVSSLPVVGLAMGVVNMPYIWGCCFFANPVRQKQNDYFAFGLECLQKTTVAQVTGEALAHENLNKEHEDYNQKSQHHKQLINREVKKVVVYAICGLVSSLLTAAFAIAMVVMGFFSNVYLITGAFILTGGSALIYAFTAYKHYRLLKA
jgi:ABC-type multidrug transport system fused ATPase/permease subunit